MNSEEVSQQIEELEALKKEAARWRTYGVLIILVTVLTCVGKIVFSVAGLAKPGDVQDEFMGYVKAGVTNQLIPTLTNSVMVKLETDIKPAVQAELRRIEGRLPDVSAAAELEIQTLMDNLPVRLTNVVAETFGVELAQREAKLRQMYPDVTEDKLTTLVSRMNSEVFEQVDRITEELFVDHLVMIDQIIVAIDKIKDSDEPDLYEKDAPWELGTLVFEVVKEEFQGLDEDDETARMMDALFEEE